MKGRGIDERMAASCMEALQVPPADARAIVGGMMSLAAGEGEGMAVVSRSAGGASLSHEAWAGLKEMNEGLSAWGGADALVVVAFGLGDGRVYIKPEGSSEAFEMLMEYD